MSSGATILNFLSRTLEPRTPEPTRPKKPAVCFWMLHWPLGVERDLDEFLNKMFCF